MSEKNKRSGKSVEHFIPAKDKRAERHIRDILKRPLDIDDDWDDYDFAPREQRFRKSQKLD